MLVYGAFVRYKFEFEQSETLIGLFFNFEDARDACIAYASAIDEDEQEYFGDNVKYFYGYAVKDLLIK